MPIVISMIQNIRKASKDFSVAVKAMLVLYSLFSAICWCHIMAGENEYNIANSITGCFLLVLALVLVFAWFSSLESKIFIASSILGLLLSTALVVGDNIEGSGIVNDISALGSTGLTSLRTYALIIGLFPICSGGISLIYLFLLQRERLLDGAEKKRLDDSGSNNVKDNDCPLVLFGCEFWGMRLTLFSAAIIFLCWIPVLLIMFPGINGYDSAYQINQFATGNLDSKHPILHTLLLGACVHLGQLLSSDELGILIYSIFQMAIMALIFGLACRCVMSFSRSRKLFIFALLWFALCPINSVFSISVTKDVLFTGLVILSMCLLYMAIQKKQDRLLVALIASLTLMLLFRNNAVIAYVVLLAGLVIWSLKHRKFNLKWGGGCYSSSCAVLGNNESY